MKQKKTSTISARQALDVLLKIGYETIPADQAERVIRPTERKFVKKNPTVELSNTGKSIRLVFTGAGGGDRARELFVPSKGMLSHGEAAGLEMRAGIRFADYV